MTDTAPADLGLPPLNTTTARRRDAGLVTAAVLLAVAYFLAPPLLVPSSSGDFSRAFVAYWSSGGRDFTPDLQNLVDHQFRYHLVRVVIALLLLAVLVTLTVKIRRFRLLIGALALTAAVLLIANVQGAVSPFGTLLSALASDSAGPDVAAAVAQVRHQVESGPTSPALDVMLEEYVRWHVFKAGLSGMVAAVLISLSIVTWSRRRRWVSVLIAVVAVAALVVVAANVITVANPDPGFLLLIEGGAIG
jgi:hypothetical protein